MEDEIAPPGPGAGSNRTFRTMALLLGAPMIAAILIGLVTVVPRIGRPAAQPNAGATETAIRSGSLTRAAIALVTQSAGTATKVPPTPSRTATASRTPRSTIAPPTARGGTSVAQVTGTATPVVQGRESATPMGTRGAGGVALITPTPEGRLGQTGISGETGGPLIILAGFGLLLVLIGARKLRSA